MREREWRCIRIRKRRRLPSVSQWLLRAKPWRALFRSVHTAGLGNLRKRSRAKMARSRERAMLTALRQGDVARYERIDPRWGRGEAIYDIW